MNKVMIDFETLDTTPTSVAFSVGFSVFDDDKVIEDNHINLRMQEQIEAGRTISADTLQFWMNQPRDLFVQLTDSPMSVADGLGEICDTITAYDVQEIWAHGVAFDVPILDSLMGDGNKTWNHRSYRCYRTLKKLFTDDNLHSLCNGIVNHNPHHPLYDAQFQAECTIVLLQKLKDLKL